MSPYFTDRSVSLTNTLCSKIRKKEGIFFTPKCIRTKLMDACGELDPVHILEPSMGSGEFIEDLLERYPKALITGVEKNSCVYDTLPEWSDRVMKLKGDFTRQKFDRKFDLIIGNPPYFQVQGADKLEFRKQYSLLEGKFDIYIVFILQCIQLLENEGVLAFVIPQTFINTQAYNRIRLHIYHHLTILDIISFPEKGWMHTKQKTIGLVLQKKQPLSNEIFSFQTPSHIILNTTESIRVLHECDTGYTIGSRGFKVKTGEIICTDKRWKDRLTDDVSCPILVHNSQLKNNKFVYKKPSGSHRPLHIDCKQYWIEEKVIVVNRGNGNNGNLRFECALINPCDWDTPLVAENHIYKIYDNGHGELEKLYRSLLSDRTLDFLSHFVGNGILSKKTILDIPISLLAPVEEV